jgi:hypothetical protein
MESMGSDVFIDGIDHQRRMIRFMEEPFHPGTYALTLTTPPPTHRATQLEEAVLAFASDKLKCPVRDLTRHENGPQTSALPTQEKVVGRFLASLASIEASIRAVRLLSAGALGQSSVGSEAAERAPWWSASGPSRWGSVTTLSGWTGRCRRPLGRWSRSIGPARRASSMPVFGRSRTPPKHGRSQHR